MLRKLFTAETSNAQVPRRKESLEYPENQTTCYQAFMKITMDLDNIDLDTISFYLGFFFVSSYQSTSNIPNLALNLQTKPCILTASSVPKTLDD